MSPLDFMNKKEPVKETPKVEEKEVIVPEKKEPVQAERKEMTNFVIHSEVDAMILDRQKSQPKSLDEIDSEVIVMSEKGKHALSLPDELEPFTKKYAFTWIYKKKQAIDEACDIYHYKFTNRTFFSLLPDHLFSARGIVERGDMILMFRPKALDVEMRKATGIESIQRIKAKEKEHEGNPNFYVPSSEKDEGKIVAV